MTMKTLLLISLLAITGIAQAEDVADVCRPVIQASRVQLKKTIASDAARQPLLLNLNVPGEKPVALFMSQNLAAMIQASPGQRLSNENVKIEPETNWPILVEDNRIYLKGNGSAKTALLTVQVPGGARYRFCLTHAAKADLVVYQVQLAGEVSPPQ